MIPNFVELKQQLSELSGVINGFKSEAVQLKLVELVFARAGGGGTPPENGNTSATPAPKRKKRRQAAVSNEAAAGSVRTSSGNGANATLTRVFTEGFFKQPRTINAIIEHCGTNLARKIKANEISGKLARMVRVNQLKRAKNADGQYEYTNA